MGDFIPYKLAIKLREKGFNYDCLFAYNDEQIINPDVVEKYGELSDDGYYELTKNGGGELDWDYVYIYETQLILKRHIILKRSFVEAPTIALVLKWLREKGIHIQSEICVSGWYCSVYTFSKDEKGLYDINDMYLISGKIYDDYKQCTLAGIEYTLDNLI